MIRKSHFVSGHIADVFSFYKRIKLLGKGSYGEVFRVQNKNTGQIFACKRLIKSKIKKKDRFKVEIDLLKATDHPNIVRLYDIYEDTISLYLIMEECLGGELFDHLAKRAKEKKMYTEKEAAKIFKQLLEAVNYLHSHGVCHRDLKPENILFSTVEEGSLIKLIDFGLSKVFFSENSTMTGAVGTTFYMAPEVLTGIYNERCDIWACGVILYIMLCGRPPFYSKDENELKAKICNMKYSLDVNNVSEDAKEIIKSILVEQNERPSASDLLETKWIKELAPNSTNAALNIDWDHIQKYSKLNLVQKCVINFSSFRLTDKETEEFVQMFKSLDENSDGVLSIEEIKQGAEKCAFLGHKVTCDDLISLFNEMDVDKNGLINFTEFISALVDYKNLLKKEKLIECFRNYDLDGNGKISFKEFIAMIKPQDKTQEENIKKLYDKFDTNNDGDIDFEEFVNGVLDAETDI